MTVKELAASAGRPINDVLDALFFVDQHNAYYVDSIFEDPKILCETVRKLGAKLIIIAPPNQRNSDEKEEDHDVHKRYTKCFNFTIHNFNTLNKFNNLSIFPDLLQILKC